MGTLDLHVRPSVPMGALGRLGQRVELGEAAPVSAQSTTKSSDVRTGTPMSTRNRWLWAFKKNPTVRATVCIRVLAVTRLNSSSLPNAASLRVQREWRRFCDITVSRLSLRDTLASRFLDLRRSKAGSRSSVDLLGEFNAILSDPAPPLAGTSTVLAAFVMNEP